jgi:transposase
MWTQKNRPRYDRDHLRYPSDLTDEEWAVVAPLIPPPRPCSWGRHDLIATLLGASILGTNGDEAIHGILDAINAKTPYDQLRWAVPIHPTVSELIPTLLLDLQPSSNV